MNETDQADEQDTVLDTEADTDPPFTWHTTRAAAFTVQTDLADAAKAAPGSDEWNDGLLNASMYYRVPDRAAAELRRIADLADSLSQGLEKLARVSDDDDWESFDPAAVDLPAMTAEVLQFGLFADAILVGAADQHREALSELANPTFDSAYAVWNADKHDLAESLLGHLRVLIGTNPGTGRTYVYRWLLLTEFTARAIDGDLAAENILNAVGLGADRVHRAKALGLSDSTDPALRKAIAQAERDLAARRSEFARWADAVLARTN
ncbi:hypothetical protein KCMC57_up00660 [Kitasatospora sp. CMC57]|uniref:Uncharacterized protein n=1 Tax=Kitasatospora sp. CMC57 TaxID=3231513 RepID=A0AB33JLD4_9ACTN